jgi:membrane protein DedA with SNARE-associated domain
MQAPIRLREAGLPGFGPKWIRLGLILLLTVAIASSIAFAMRSYGALSLLRSAQAVGAAETSSIRPWMTLDFVVAHYGTAEDDLRQRLQIGAEVRGTATLRDLAEEKGFAPFRYLAEVQAAIAADAAHAPPPAAEEPQGWLASTTEGFLSSLLVYGYPALALILFLGAIGLPVPAAVAATIAGSLAGQGHLSAAAAGAVAVAALVVGDIVGYGLGRLADRRLVERYGHWIGYTERNRRRACSLFSRWGAATVLLTRTLVSHLSSVLSVLAGLTRYSLARFAAFAALGRIVWTAAYVGLGYSVGADFEAASAFLANLSGLLVSLAMALAAAVLLGRGGTLSRRGSAEPPAPRP